MSTQTPTRSPRRLRRPRILAIQALPTLVTLGNVLAGVLAISYLVDASSLGAAEVVAREKLWAKAAWVIFVGMICDALDGRVARLTGTASAFGAELDSLADVITFGVAPAILAKSVVQHDLDFLSPRLLMVLAMVYVVGAALRLARYNVESLRVSVPGHVTHFFRGLPSPGSAGVIAGIVLFRHVYVVPGLTWALLVGMPALGLLMVSRFPYPHLINRFVGEALSPIGIVILVIAVYLGIELPEALLGGAFVTYALAGPVAALTRLTTGHPRWAFEEDEDEVEDTDVLVDEARRARVRDDEDGDDPDGAERDVDS